MLVPLGVGAALFLEEYGSRRSRITRLIEVNIQNLAGVPSIIYGLLGLAFIARAPLDLGYVVLTASMTLTLLVLPVVILASREAVRAVPDSIREGSLALGATKWQTIRRQVLPASIPGIATGVILAISRAIGETAPLIPLGAATFVTFTPGPTTDFTAMPLVIFNWVKQPQPEFQALAAAGVLLLIALLIVMNFFAIWLRNRYEQTW
jgi:phosphate transport system permease protein